MKKTTILVSLIVFTGITVILPLFGTDDSYCNAQILPKSLLQRIEVKATKEEIIKNLETLKDTTRDKGNNKSDERFMSFYGLGGGDYSETYNEVAKTLADILENDPNDRVRAVAASVFHVLNDYSDSLDIKVIKTLEKALNDKAVEIKLEVAGALVNLGYYKENNAYSILENFVRGKDNEKWDLESTKTNDPLELEYYNEEAARYRIRNKAILYIAIVHTPETEALLVEMTKDPRESVRNHAIAMLKEHFNRK